MTSNGVRPPSAAGRCSGRACRNSRKANSCSRTCRRWLDRRGRNSVRAWTTRGGIRSRHKRMCAHWHMPRRAPALMWSRAQCQFVIGIALLAAEVEHVYAFRADTLHRRAFRLEVRPAVAAEAEERFTLRRLAPRPSPRGCTWHHLTPFLGVPCGPGKRRAPA